MSQPPQNMDSIAHQIIEKAKIDDQLTKGIKIINHISEGKERERMLNKQRYIANHYMRILGLT